MIYNCQDKDAINFEIKWYYPQNVVGPVICGLVLDPKLSQRIVSSHNARLFVSRLLKHASKFIHNNGTRLRMSERWFIGTVLYA